MLVLSRRLNEEVVFTINKGTPEEKEIYVLVKKIGKSRVVLGINCSKEIRIEFKNQKFSKESSKISS